MSNDNNVTELRSVVTINEELVTSLTNLLEDARSGRLVWISYFAQRTGGDVIEGTAGPKDDAYALAGRWLAMAVNHARGF